MSFGTMSNFPNPAAPGALLLPRDEWDREPWNRWAFHNVRSVLPTAQVWRGRGEPSALPAEYQDLERLAFSFDGEQHTIDHFLTEQFTDAILVLHRGRIIMERYLNGMTDRAPHLSQSVAKSVVATVAGTFVDRGSLDPSAPVTDYLPELERTAYRGATVQHILDMTSGVLFNETYTSKTSHMAKLDVAAGWKVGDAPDWPRTVWDLILTLREMECAHGTAFRYRSIETDVLAFILQRLGKLPLADLVSQELWSRIGAEEDAYFTVDPAGYALANGGFNATLRDYARFALLHINRGRIGSTQVVPEMWFEEIRFGKSVPFGTAGSPSLPRGSYHNQFWIEDDVRRAYMARGVFGQLIYIDPDNEFGAVVLSSWPEFLSDTRARMALAAVHAICNSLQA